MAMEFRPNELHSRDIISVIDADLRERTARMRAETEFGPGLSIHCENLEHKPSLQYMDIKTNIGKRLGFKVSSSRLPSSGNPLASMIRGIDRDNQHPHTNGIIVQLPLRDRAATDAVVGEIAPRKDVDGLGTGSLFAPATPLAVIELMNGYGIDYLSQRVAVLGKGRLVGAPLIRTMVESGAEYVNGFDVHSDPLDVIKGINEADIIISAMGKPGLLEPNLFTSTEPKVLIDAGAAEQAGAVHGDVSPLLREFANENGWQITPEKGGVGPLTVRALFQNVMAAAEQQTVVGV